MNKIIFISAIAVFLAALLISDSSLAARIAPPCSILPDPVKLKKFNERVKVEECPKKFTDVNCIAKCVFEKHGYFDKKGNFRPEAVSSYLKAVGNNTESFRKAVLSVNQDCATAADEEVKQMKKKNSGGVDGCTKYGVFIKCIEKKAQTMMSNMSQYC